MQRISMSDYKAALAKRYKDLAETAKLLAVIDGIDHTSKNVQEMKAIAAIAKLHGVDVRKES